MTIKLGSSSINQQQSTCRTSLSISAQEIFHSRTLPICHHQQSDSNNDKQTYYGKSQTKTTTSMLTTWLCRWPITVITVVVRCPFIHHHNNSTHNYYVIKPQTTYMGWRFDIQMFMDGQAILWWGWNYGSYNKQTNKQTKWIEKLDHYIKNERQHPISYVISLILLCTYHTVLIFLPNASSSSWSKRISCVHGWMDEWMDGWMDEWMDGWMDGWMDHPTNNNNSNTKPQQHPSPITPLPGPIWITVQEW